MMMKMKMIADNGEEDEDMTSMMMIIVLYDNDQHRSLSSSLTMRMM